MARHRSPGGRNASQPAPSVVHGHPTEGRGAHRSTSTPLRRGATAVAVAGGALSLVGAGVPMVIQSAEQAAEPAGLAGYTAVPAAAQQATADAVVRTAFEPVAPVAEPAVASGAALVKSVQLYEQQEQARVAAEQQAAAEQQRAAEEQERAAEEEAEEYGDGGGDGDGGGSGGGGGGAVAATTGAPDCDLDTSGLGAVKAHVREAAQFLGCQYGEPAMHGVAGRAGASDHPSGLAIDFMVDRATGDALAECALQNREALGIKYVIWEQRINHGDGWEGMEDRGGATANHFDHVHVSFNAGAGSGDFTGC